ncbi:hypothetical protein [Streptomyces cavernae]|uniref:hypothetical protein n=1 Tax=Streptomyces cavernae TaxID=2259034 RepID=UPI000FEBE7DE|nr:hypothetical protein [Streptomyces cavernae]
MRPRGDAFLADVHIRGPPLGVGGAPLDGDADLLVSDVNGGTSVLLPGARSGIGTTAVRELPLVPAFPQ